MSQAATLTMAQAAAAQYRRGAILVTGATIVWSSAGLLARLVHLPAVQPPPAAPRGVPQPPPVGSLRLQRGVAGHPLLGPLKAAAAGPLRTR